MLTLKQCTMGLQNLTKEQMQVLRKTDVSGSLPTDRQIELKADEYMTEVQSNAYAYNRNTGWQYSDVIEAFREGAKWARMQGNNR